MSEFQQTFAHRHLYSNADAISIPIVLMSDNLTFVDILGKLDTGSTFCIFERHFADLLNINLENALETRIRTATGIFYAFGQEINLSVFDYEWTTTVYFAESESFGLNILGRIGFLDHLRIGLIDYEQLLYCGIYD
ncbi:hypothetical protein BH10ACI1_BH10ACI1_35280 [soil metagenome]